MSLWDSKFTNTFLCSILLFSGLIKRIGSIPKIVSEQEKELKTHETDLSKHMKKSLEQIKEIQAAHRLCESRIADFDALLKAGGQNSEAAGKDLKKQLEESKENNENLVRTFELERKKFLETGDKQQEFIKCLKGRNFLNLVFNRLSAKILKLPSLFKQVVHHFLSRDLL